MTTPREFLSRYLSPTPLVRARSLGPNVFLKLETGLPTGSFKVRGALWALAAGLKARATVGAQGFSPAEVVASSTGNHGAAVAWAAQQLGVRATIFLPRNPNPVKRANIERCGAAIIEEGADLAEAYQAACRYVERTGAFFLNDATDPDLPAGPATIADEILDALPHAAVIYAPVGDTALIRGVAASAKARVPSIRIVGVQAERAPSYYLSWQSGAATPTASADTIADGLATRTPVLANVDAIRQLVDDMCLVSERAMVAAVHRLRRDENVAAEPSAAATVAAFLERAPDGSGPVVLLITGRNAPADVDADDQA